MLRNSLQRRLRMEVLEDKRPLAANLFVDVVDGDLIITGDAGDNRFFIQSGSPQGEQFEIGSLGTFGDTINGDLFLTSGHFFSGVTRNIIINLGDGSDFVNIKGVNGVNVLDMPGDLRIDMGGGDDRIALGIGDSPLFDNPISEFAFPLNIANNLVIDMGAGNDLAWIASTTVGNDFSYSNPQGDASLLFLRETIFVSLGMESEIGRDFKINAGGGADEIVLEDINVGRDMLISVGAGDDIVKLANIDVARSTLANLGSGNDQAELEFSNLGSSLTVLGSGSNVILIQEVDTSSSVSILTSSGNDGILLAGVQTGTVLISAGAGDDELFILDSVFDNLLVSMGGGADTLNIGGTTVNGLTLLLGGGGFDTLIDLGGNSFFLALDLGFESFMSCSMVEYE